MPEVKTNRGISRLHLGLFKTQINISSSISLCFDHQTPNRFIKIIDRCFLQPWSKAGRPHCSIWFTAADMLELVSWGSVELQRCLFVDEPDWSLSEGALINRKPLISSRPGPIGGAWDTCYLPADRHLCLLTNSWHKLMPVRGAGEGWVTHARIDPTLWDAGSGTTWDPLRAVILNHVSCTWLSQMESGLSMGVAQIIGRSTAREATKTSGVKVKQSSASSAQCVCGDFYLLRDCLAKQFSCCGHMLRAQGSQPDVPIIINSDNAGGRGEVRLRSTIVRCRPWCCNLETTEDWIDSYTWHQEHYNVVSIWFWGVRLHQCEDNRLQLWGC